MKSKWKKVELGELATLYSGGTPSKQNPEYWGGDIPWITVKDMKEMFFSSTNLFLTQAGSETLRIMPAHTIYMLVRGMGLFKDLPVLYCNQPATFNQDIKALVVKTFVDPLFLAYSLKAKKDEILRLVDTAGHGTGRLDTELVKSIPILLPTKEEQMKIVSVLKAWDEAIDKLQALAITKRKKHSQATNALLFPKEPGRRKKNGKRLQQLADVTRELTQRNNGLNLGREFVMGVSNSKGIVPMRKQSIGGDLSRYKVLPPRAFAYNPMRINVGSIAMSRLDSCVLVSPDYVLFQCVDDRLDPDYLDHLCNTHWWSHHINAGGSGSVRMRTYYDDLAALRLELPDFEEQKKISSYLNAARRENDLIGDQINALQRQKRGLMQKLLTGEWRVKC